VIQDYVSEQSGANSAAAPTKSAREILQVGIVDNHKLSSNAGMTRFLINFSSPRTKQPKEGQSALCRGGLSAAYAVLNGPP